MTMVKPHVTLKMLYEFKKRVKTEILGQEDTEYRSELEHLLECTNREIREMEKQRKNVV